MCERKANYGGYSEGGMITSTHTCTMPPDAVGHSGNDRSDGEASSVGGVFGLPVAAKLYRYLSSRQSNTDATLVKMHFIHDAIGFVATRICV